MVSFRDSAVFCVVRLSRASGVVRNRGRIPLGAFVPISAQLVHCETWGSVSQRVNLKPDSIRVAMRPA